MEFAYAAADVMLTRAGALTCSELLVTGTPAILVPSSAVVDDHQTRNAEVMIAAGAAKLLPETQLTSAKVVDLVEGLLGEPSILSELRSNALAHATPDAARVIATEVLDLAGFGNGGQMGLILDAV